MDKVLDPDCTPLTQEDMSSLNDEQKFMCSVFYATSQTDRGKKFVREYEDECDA